MELGAEAERRMKRFQVMHPQNERGRHEYTLNGAGLDLETERGRFETAQSWVRLLAPHLARSGFF
jgi:hypothetical protein